MCIEARLIRFPGEGTVSNTDVPVVDPTKVYKANESGSVSDRICKASGSSLVQLLKLRCW